MTKKLNAWQKEANKQRRSALIAIKHLLENKSVIVKYEVTYDYGRTLDERIIPLGVHHLQVDWRDKLKRMKKL